MVESVVKIYLIILIWSGLCDLLVKLFRAFRSWTLNGRLVISDACLRSLLRGASMAVVGYVVLDLFISGRVLVQATLLLVMSLLIVQEYVLYLTGKLHLAKLQNSESEKDQRVGRTAIEGRRGGWFVLENVLVYGLAGWVAALVTRLLVGTISLRFQLALTLMSMLLGGLMALWQLKVDKARQ